MKIKVVQIALAVSKNNTLIEQYLDDKGCVWVYFSPTPAWPAHWEQIDLPEEPIVEVQE